jgi:hypothetical protein
MTSGGRYRTQPIGYASGGLLPNCLMVAILLLLRDAQTVERISGYAHRAFCDCGIVRGDARKISHFAFEYAAVMIRALAMR